MLIALKVSGKEKTYTPEEILALRYRMDKDPSVIITDPDLGAGGNLAAWRAMRRSK